MSSLPLKTMVDKKDRPMIVDHRGFGSDFGRIRVFVLGPDPPVFQVAWTKKY